MKKIELGRTGIEAFPIAYGGVISMEVGQEKSDEYVEYAIKKGVNYFDIAPSYGDAQKIMGESIRPYVKDIHIACKTFERDCENAKRELEESLQMLHTDSFAVYQMHSVQSVEDVENAFRKGGSFEVILSAKEQGIAKNIGISCHSEEAALRALELYDFDTVLYPTNWALFEAKGFGKRVLNIIQERNLGFLGMKSMIERSWSDEERYASLYPKSWCKPFVTNNEALLPAMRYVTNIIKPHVLVTPGNFEHFSFAVENIDKIFSAFSSQDENILKKELANIGDQFFF